MAQFFGTLQGARGPTSRLGDKSSGLEVTAQSYEGDIVVFLSYDEVNECNHVSIGVREHGNRPLVYLYGGPIKSLLDSEWRNALVRTFAEEALRKEGRHE